MKAIPQNLGFVDRNDPDTALDLEVNFLVSKKRIRLKYRALYKCQRS